MRKRLRIRMALLALVALVAVGVGIAFYEADVLRSLELDSVDARFAVRGDEKPPSDLVVVGIDAETLHRLRLQFPFTRELHARVIDRLKADGARVVAFDIAFDTPGREPKRFCNFAGQRLAPGDCALLRSTARAKNVVYSAVDVGKHGAIPFFGFPATPKVLRQFGADAGYTGIADDVDGTTRRYLAGFNGLDSFARVVVAREGASPPPESEFGSDGSAYIDFYGGPGSIPTIPYWKVLQGKTAPGAFRGKTVVVGATDPTLKDVFTTSTTGGTLMSGPELQAHAIATARRDNPLRDASHGVNILLIVVLGLVAPAGAAAWRLRGLAVAVVVGLLFVVAAQLAFNGDRIVA